MENTQKIEVPLKCDEVIANLGMEHRSFLALFRSALSSGIRTEKGKSKFLEAKFELLNHHENELIQVYKPLQENREAKRRAIHSSNIHNNRCDDEISLGFVHTLEMLHEFEESLNADDIESEAKLMGLITSLTDRIDFEESVVFQMYRNLEPSS